MKIRTINAPSAPQAGGASFAQAVEVSGAARTLYFSAQIGTDAGGETPKEFVDQAWQAWNNLIAQLNAANMTLDNLVKVTIFLADRKHVADHRKVRLEVLEGRQVALTTVFAGLFDEKWLIAIDAVAAA